MTPWTSLARRAGEAKGPDLDLESAVWGLADGSNRRNMAYSASVDAVLALVREKLPGWKRYIEEVREGRWFGGLQPPGQATSGYRGDLSAYAATPALALLSAFCLAMAAKAGERDSR